MTYQSYSLRTSESVCEGHPDKLADQISDAILDAHLLSDPFSKCAVETLATKNLILIAGEVTSDASVDFEAVARGVARGVGYTSDELGLDADNCEVQVRIQKQSREIGRGVAIGGAGDQGIMFGCATRETDTLMPLPIMVAHALTAQATLVRKQHPELGLRPDGKAQVTIQYRGTHDPELESIVISLQHEPDVLERVSDIASDEIVRPVLVRFPQLDASNLDMHINPAGSFVEGGPATDTGLTGRKVMVDTYGGAIPHGGGAFSGKDSTKVDRSGAYMARFAAKTLVSMGFVDAAVVSVAYAIGQSEPLAVELEDAHGSKEGVAEAKRFLQSFDFSPSTIRYALNLHMPIYRNTARNGHFGHPGFPWEDLATARKGVGR